MRHAFEDTVGVPAGGLRPSPNHLIRPLEERRRDRQAEGLGGLEVDDEFESCRLLHRQVGRLSAPENLVNIDGAATPELGNVDAIRDEAARPPLGIPATHEWRGCGARPPARLAVFCTRT
jgi:hypothetical protein